MDLVVYHQGRFATFKTGESPLQGERYVCVVPRDTVCVERIRLPRVALEEGGMDALRYQASKLFNLEAPSVAYLEVSSDESEVELLLFAIEERLLDEIFYKGKELGLRIAGVSLASVMVREVETGCVWVQWDSGSEVCVYRDGKPVDVFFVFDDEQKKVLAVECPSNFNFGPEGYDETEIDWNVVLFKNPYEEKATVDLKKLFVVVLLLLCAGLGLYLNGLRNRISVLNAERDSLLAKWEYVQKQKEKIEKLSERLRELKSLWDGVRPVATLARIAKTIPKGTIVTYVLLEDSRCELEGLTPSVPSLLERLGSQKWVKDLKLVFSRKNRRFGDFKGEFFKLRFKMQEARDVKG